MEEGPHGRETARDGPPAEAFPVQVVQECPHHGLVDGFRVGRIATAVFGEERLELAQIAGIGRPGMPGVITLDLEMIEECADQFLHGRSSLLEGLAGLVCLSGLVRKVRLDVPVRLVGTGGMRLGGPDAMLA